MADLRTRIGGIEIENPVVVASGPLSDSEEIIRKASSFNPGAIILKSSLIDRDYQKIMKPVAPYEYPQLMRCYITAYEGQMHADGMSHWAIEKWCEWLPKNKGKFRPLLIASVCGITLEGYIEGAKMFEEAGADALEILFACPAPWFHGYKYSMTGDPQVIGEVCSEIRKAVKMPIGAKVFPLMPGWTGSPWVE